MERMEEDAKDLEKMASKQTLLHQKIDDCSKKIRDLGSLPSEAFDKYQVSVKFSDLILHEYTSSIFSLFIQVMLFLEILSQCCSFIVKKRSAFLYCHQIDSSFSFVGGRDSQQKKKKSQKACYMPFCKTLIVEESQEGWLIYFW